MTATTDFKSDSYSLNGRGYLSMKKPDEIGFTEGVFWGRHGFVVIWVNPRSKFTEMLMPREGRMHIRKWPKIWAPRTIARLARQFSEDVCSGQAAA